MLERVGSSAISVASKYWDIDTETEEGAIKAGAAAVASVSAAGVLGLAGVEVVHTFGFINTLWAVGAGAVSLVIILCPPIKAKVPNPYITADAEDERRKSASSGIGNMVKALSAGPASTMSGSPYSNMGAILKQTMEKRAKADKCPYPDHGDDCKMYTRMATYDTVHVYNGGSEIAVIHGPNRRAQ